jgi:mannose-1-phosphate guanylyltransferase
MENGPMAGRRWALVLAGGEGTRLQRLTREICGAPVPKQYCRCLLGGRSLLEVTLDRVRHFTAIEHTVVIVNRDHLPFATDQLRALPRDNIIVQPCNRDTGPGLVFALEHVAQRDPKATIAVFPSDHFVDDDRKFVSYSQQAAGIVSRLPEKVILLGIRPDHPESGYGYVTLSRRLRTSAAEGVAFRVGAFVEKPAHDEARELVEAGALWNSFVTVFRLRRMLELIRHVIPAEVHRIDELREHRRVFTEGYHEITPWNFSSRVLARIPRELLVVPVEGVYWSDWGTRASIECTLRALHRSPPWLARKLPAPAVVQPLKATPTVHVRSRAGTARQGRRRALARTANAHASRWVGVGRMAAEPVGAVAGEGNPMLQAVPRHDRPPLATKSRRRRQSPWRCVANA